METVYGTPTEIEINGEKYTLQSEDHKDQVFYHVTKGGEELCVVSISEEGVWEANCDIDENLVRAIGEQIERKEI